MKQVALIGRARIFVLKTDWVLLVFLLLMLNTKVVVKLAALVFIFIVRPDISFGLRLKNSRLSWFYPLIALVGVFDFVLFGSKTGAYPVVFATGIAFWLACLLAMHQVKYAVEKRPAEHIHRALHVLFILNCIFSFAQLALIMLEIREWNPYTYQGNFQKYFIGTGDYIHGLSFDTSTTNAVISAFGVFYFLKRGSYGWSLLCMGTLLLTGSNFVNIVTLLGFVLCFVIHSNRQEKSVMVICVACLVLFMAKVSPQNNDYAVKVMTHFYPVKKDTAAIRGISKKQAEHLSEEESARQKIARNYLDSLAHTMLPANKIPQYPLTAVRPVVPVANIHTPPFQHKRDSSTTHLQILKFAEQMGRDTSIRAEKAAALRPAGKVLAAAETFVFLKAHPFQMMTGNGIANFSSKLAFRVTGLRVAGGYPVQYTYINNDFRDNHLAIFLDYFEKDTGFHSVTNTPNSVYLQMAGEYGLAGLVLLGFYLSFFMKGARRLGYGLPVLFVFTVMLLSDYWFEQLSVVVLFELLLFLNKKESDPQKLKGV